MYVKRKLLIEGFILKVDTLVTLHPIAIVGAQCLRFRHKPRCTWHATTVRKAVMSSRLLEENI